MATPRNKGTIARRLLAPWQELRTRLNAIPPEQLARIKKFGLWSLAGLAFLYAVTWWSMNYFARGTATKTLAASLVSARTTPTNLLVVVHHFTGSSNKMFDVQHAITNARPQTDVLMVEHPASLLSNADCFQLADQLCNRVNERWTNGRYQGIEFVGYSMGALLVRKAYVYGWGCVEDLNPADDAPPATRPTQPWVTNTTRMVLLAGMNRGWTSRTRPNGMKFGAWVVIKAAKFMCFMTGTGKMIQQCEAGHPFVANLRMQWLDVYRKTRNQPLIVQLLGDADDLVTREDERDISVSKDFVWVQLSGTAHQNAADFTGENLSWWQSLLWSDKKKSLYRDYAKQREKKFLQALGGADEIAAFRRASPAVPGAEDTNVVAGVVVLHGIRDLGTDWTSQFGDALQEQFMKGNTNNHKLCIYRPTYGYFDMVSFLLWPERQAKVRWFMDELTELQAKYPNMTNLYFIGHSHGTYVLASALKKYRALKLQRAVFAGSVVPQHYNWISPALSNRIHAVRNYVGSDDLVVALFPRLFELWDRDSDLGSAGYNGFTKPAAVPEATWTNFMMETKCVIGRHDAAIQGGDPNMIASIARFIIHGENVEPNRTTKVQRGLAKFVTGPIMCPVSWAILLMVVGSGGVYATFGIRRALARTINKFQFLLRHQPLLVGVLAWSIYVGGVWFLLSKI